MKYYKDKNNEIYAYEDNEKPIQKGLTLINEAELNEILAGETDERAERLAEVEAEIAECKNYINHALIIGNSAVLENLRAEYKELIADREKLNATSEPITVAPTDHL
ncbi:hypothetical protein [uncultured Campylobacter sp.]|uniref:hypothetical protein n=1 Tax=uncultured Campylobacter sp. TaxID=218934 RepID=UPI00206C3E08|nr:hypothetical protein [uncultured Campylobacter sp.]DAO63957.1 MAG TPA: hypothetical protein [Caudoviricetes sp.]